MNTEKTIPTNCILAIYSILFNITWVYFLHTNSKYIKFLNQLDDTTNLVHFFNKRFVKLKLTKRIPHEKEMFGGCNGSVMSKYAAY
jgi:hypothetical protein